VSRKLRGGRCAPDAGTRPNGRELSTVPLLLADGRADLIAALITMGVAIVIAFAVDRLVIARGGRVASRMAETTLSRTTQTRLRLIRRLIFVTILAIGAALALSRFGQFSRLATGILASSAVLGLVVGFAARQTLANMVAGILLAITQPIRVGDNVTIADNTGRVDDLTLSYTFLDPGDGRLVVVPNEQVLSAPVFNHSTGDRTAPATVSVWLPPAASLDEARRVLKPAGAREISVAEITPEGVRLELKGPRDRERTQVGDEESDLRAHAHHALRAAGLLEEAGR
jgi:small-conductance mechanosensitive channel